MQSPEKSSTVTFSQANLPPELSIKLASEWIINNVLIISNNYRLGSAFYDLDSRLSLLCQIGDDVILP